MALVRVFSDLHLEFGTNVIKKCIDMCSKNPTKYTILAGDITNFKKRESILTSLVSELKKFTEHIIYVLGNHEYYEPGNKSVQEIKSEYQMLSEKLGITLLEDDYLETDDFVFYGTTMWTKPSPMAFFSMNDRYSFKGIQEIIDIHENSALSLNKFVTNYANPKPLVVITHHLPSYKLIDKEYEHYKELNSGFASELDHLIKDPISHWIYGHTHKPNNKLINSVKLICNPHGYPKERYSRAEYPDCTF